MTTLVIKDLNISEELDRKDMTAINGGSIYVDGNYRGEGQLDFHAWPGGVPVYNVWPDGSRTPY